MKRKNKILFLIYVLLGSIMFCEATMLIINKELKFAILDILFGIGFGCIGFVYLLSSKKE